MRHDNDGSAPARACFPEAVEVDEIGRHSPLDSDKAIHGARMIGRARIHPFEREIGDLDIESGYILDQAKLIASRSRAERH
jgi:hypothetical protein